MGTAGERAGQDAVKNVLIIWGGGAGHHPLSVATRVGEMLAPSCTVTLTSNFAVLMNEDLTAYDVIVPVWSCGITSDLTDFSIVSDQYPGRVFYTTLAHSPEHFFESPNLTMILNAITWCAGD